MARDQINGLSQIAAGTVTRAAMNTATAGKAVITRIIAGTGLTVSASTGADSGTGDVTLAVSGGSSWAGTWTSYTPTVTFTGGTSPTASTQAGSFTTNGKTLFLNASATIAFSGGSQPGSIIFSLPAGMTASGVSVGGSVEIQSGSVVNNGVATCASGATTIAAVIILAATATTVAVSATIQLA